MTGAAVDAGSAALLVEAHRRASRADGPGPLAGVLAESARQVLGASATVVLVREPLSHEVRASAVSGAPADGVAGLVRAVGALAADLPGPCALGASDGAVVEQLLARLGGSRLLVVPLTGARGDDVGLLVAGVADDVDPAGHDVAQLRCSAEAELVRGLRTEQLERRALYDAATGLPAPVLLEAAVAEALATAGDDEVALLVVSVDQLQSVARSFGRVVADELARKVAARLVVAAGEAARVARLPQGFGVLVRGRPGGAADLAARVLRRLQDPWTVGRRQVRSTCRAGVAVAAPGTTPALLLQQAESAWSAAGRRPQGGWVLYGADLTATAHEQLVLETLMQAALAGGEFAVRYQPQVEVSSGRVVGAEALVRWHRASGVVAPDRFIPAAEATGVVVDIDRWVMGEAFSQARRWLDDGLGRLRMAVNVSGATLAEPGFAASVLDAVGAAALDPHDVEVEVTESLELLEGVDAVGELAVLRDAGVHVALDDFGTGWSNVGRLRSLPVDRVKIDRSFVSQIGADGDGEALCAAVIGLARTLDLDVLAEGVETTHQLAVLQERGCTEFQGYLTSPPVPADAFAALVAR